MSDSRRLPEEARRDAPFHSRQVKNEKCEEDSHIPPDREDRNPGRDSRRQPQVGKRENDEKRGREELVGERIQDRSERRALVANPGDETVEPVGHGRDEERRERPTEVAVDHQNDQRRYQDRSGGA